MTYPAIEVAKYIVNYCTEKKQAISNLKLQKILYFIWIDYYKITKDKLYNDEIYAWQLGPVVPEVYYEYCSYAGLPISLKIDSQITKEDQLTLSKIIDKYVTFSARKLVNMTHEKNKPWDLVYKNGVGNRNEIPFSVIIDLECQ